MLRMAVPGNPGEDYPIYAEVPETVFSCEGRVEGGFYADPEAECQPFHVCSADRDGGLTKNSFLCPNGTLFNQENFVCEYWFNVDCSLAESFYGLNDNIGTVEGGDGLAGAASSPTGGYASPPDTPLSSYGLGDENKSLRSGRREGRLIVDARRNAASPPVTGSTTSNTRFVNFPVNIDSPNSSRKIKEPKIPSKKIQSNNNRRRKTSRVDKNTRNRRPNIPKKKIQNRPNNSRILETPRNPSKNPRNKIETTRNQFERASKPLNPRKSPSANNSRIFETPRTPNKNLRNKIETTRNQFERASKLSNARKSPSPNSSRILDTPRNPNHNPRNKIETTRNQFESASKLSNARKSATSKRTGKNFKRRKPTNQKRVRGGRNEVLPGYIPPAGDTAAPSDSYTAGDSSLAASSPDYDYEEAPLATYAGASDTAGHSGYISPAADTGHTAGSADTAYGAPAGNSDDVDALADAVYEEDTLPTYNNGVYNNGNSDDGSSYSAPVADSVYGSDSDYEDILPAYNNGVYNNAGSDSSKTEGTSYTAPFADSYGAPAGSADDGYGSPSASPSDSYGIPLADSDYEEDTLPQYNNGVYNDGGSTSSATGGTSYTAPTSDSYGAPSSTLSDSYGSPLADSDYKEDILPQYNKGVYNNGGSGTSSQEGTSYTAPSADSYGAPSADSYGAPSDSSATGDAAAATGYAGPAQNAATAGSRPIPGSYKDPEADILPEYFKSEITLGLNDIDDVSRVDPFLSDYGSPAGDSYRQAGSSPVAAVVKTPVVTP